MSSTINYVTKEQLLGTIYAMVAITSLFFTARLAIRIWRPKAIMAEDILILLAYLSFLTTAVLYIIVTPAMYRVSDALTGISTPYAAMVDDSLFLIKIFFATTMLLWFTLWTVKFSLLALYRRLMKGVRTYMQLWWAVVVFCFVTLIGCFISNFVSCHSIHAWFTPGECTTPRDIRGQIGSLYYSFAVDVLTDLLIMILPLGLIYNLQRPFAQKVGIGALFCIGWVCIIVAVIRVVQIGIKADNSSTPSSSWLALWAVVESAIAVIISCCPGLYSTARDLQRSSRSGTIVRTGAGYRYESNSRGWSSTKVNSANAANGSGSDDDRAGKYNALKMKYLATDFGTGFTSSKQTKRPGSLASGFWNEQHTSSQEDLTQTARTGNVLGEIQVTTSVEIKESDEMDGHSSETANEEDGYKRLGYAV